MLTVCVILPMVVPNFGNSLKMETGDKKGKKREKEARETGLTAI